MQKHRRWHASESSQIKFGRLPGKSWYSLHDDGEAVLIAVSAIERNATADNRKGIPPLRDTD